MSLLFEVSTISSYILKVNIEYIIYEQAAVILTIWSENSTISAQSGGGDGRAERG